jgi:hypothetical protein
MTSVGLGTTAAGAVDGCPTGPASYTYSADDINAPDGDFRFSYNLNDAADSADDWCVWIKVRDASRQLDDCFDAMYDWHLTDDLAGHPHYDTRQFISCDQTTAGVAGPWHIFAFTDNEASKQWIDRLQNYARCTRDGAAFGPFQAADCVSLIGTLSDPVDDSGSKWPRSPTQSPQNTRGDLFVWLAGATGNPTCYNQGAEDTDCQWAGSDP